MQAVRVNRLTVSALTSVSRDVLFEWTICVIVCRPNYSPNSRNWTASENLSNTNSNSFNATTKAAADSLRRRQRRFPTIITSITAATISVAVTAEAAAAAVESPTCPTRPPTLPWFPWRRLRRSVVPLPSAHHRLAARQLPEYFRLCSTVSSITSRNDPRRSTASCAARLARQHRSAALASCSSSNNNSSSTIINITIADRVTSVAISRHRRTGCSAVVEAVRRAVRADTASSDPCRDPDSSAAAIYCRRVGWTRRTGGRSSGAMRRCPPDRRRLVAKAHRCDRWVLRRAGRILPLSDRRCRAPPIGRSSPSISHRRRRRTVRVSRRHPSTRTRVASANRRRIAETAHSAAERGSKRRAVAPFDSTVIIIITIINHSNSSTNNNISNSSRNNHSVNTSDGRRSSTAIGTRRFRPPPTSKMEQTSTAMRMMTTTIYPPCRVEGRSDELSST